MIFHPRNYSILRYDPERSYSQDEVILLNNRYWMKVAVGSSFGKPKYPDWRMLRDGEDMDTVEPRLYDHVLSRQGYYGMGTHVTFDGRPWVSIRRVGSYDSGPRFGSVTWEPEDVVVPEIPLLPDGALAEDYPIGQVLQASDGRFLQVTDTYWAGSRSWSTVNRFEASSRHRQFVFSHPELFMPESVAVPAELQSGQGRLEDEDTFHFITHSGEEYTHTRLTNETSEQWEQRINAYQTVLDLELAAELVGMEREPEPATQYTEIVFEPTAEEHMPLAPGKVCTCESCKSFRSEPNLLVNRGVHEYNYEPTWRLLRTANDPDNYFFGIELETDNAQGRISRDIAASLGRPSDFWTPKHDGSVSGPEFVSHPATLAYWREREDDLTEMFKMLIHAGYRSHDGNRAGMHVNISRTAFDEPKQLYRFLTLLEHTPSWSTTMSQRTPETARHWANLGAMTNDTATRRAVAEGYRATGHVALVNTDNHNRYEFRLPRGTLRIDRFYKNIEWTAAMIEYTREARLNSCTPSKFMAWARRKQSEYPFLLAFLSEKFGIAV